MRFINPLTIFSLISIPVCLAQTNSGAYHTRVHEQVGPGETRQDRFVFRAFVEGSGLTESFPFNSVSVQGPSVSESLAFEDGRWSYEDDLVGVSQAQYSSTYPDGTYTMNGSGDTASVSVVSNYPNQPVVTVNNGSWQGGRLIMTAEQAANDLSIITNESTGNGFVSLEVFDLDSGEDLANVVLGTANSITYQLSGGSLLPGHRYEVYIEYDEVTDSVNGLDDGTTFGLASSGTKIEIYVQSPVLQTVFTATGQKTGRLDFTGESGVTYRLMRSTSLNSGAEIDSLVGTGAAAVFSFDDSASSDPAVFYWIEGEAAQSAPNPAAFASLIGGKTYRGYSFTANNRWSQFGFTGDWSYVTTGSQTGIVMLTYDDLDNNPSEEREEFELDFGVDGDTTTVETIQSFYNNDVAEISTNYTLDLTQNSFAPELEIIEELLVGQTYLGYTFTSLSRFTFGGSEPGNWSFTYPDDDSIRITVTYDDDGNNGNVYREEIDLNFNGTTNVPYQYREYSTNTQINSGSGTLELVQP